MMFDDPAEVEPVEAAPVSPRPLQRENATPYSAKTKRKGDCLYNGRPYRMGRSGVTVFDASGWAGFQTMLEG